MSEKRQPIPIVDQTFSDLYAYVYRRVEDSGVINDVLEGVYTKLLRLESFNKEQVLLIAYQLAYSVLKEQKISLREDDFWNKFLEEEAELLRLRFLEDLNSFEIAFVLSKPVSKIDSFLYAAFLKARNFLPEGFDNCCVGAYFVALNVYFKQMKEKEEVIPSEDFKLVLIEKFFANSYNREREVRYPLEEGACEQGAIRERSEVVDFFNKPMEKIEREQFVSSKVVAGSSETSCWIPEDKESLLPKDNPEGYGMDLLKTFMKKKEFEENGKKRLFNFVKPESKVDSGSHDVEQSFEENDFKEEFVVPGSLVESGRNECNDEFEKLEERVDSTWRSIRKSIISPLVAFIIVFAGVLWFPFSSDPVLETDYQVTYVGDFTFEEKQDFLTAVLKDLLVEREVEDVRIDRLGVKNVQLTFRLKNAGQKVGEIFVFYKMKDGRWAPIKYEVIWGN